MPIKNDDQLVVHYTGTLADGTIFDSSRGREPLEFTMGKRMLIEGFEKALIGKEVGDTVTVTIPPEEAYGELDEALIFEVPISELPEEIKPEIGMQLSLSNEEGDLNVEVCKITDDTIALNANHPLAGQPLTFEIEVISVK